MGSIPIARSRAIILEELQRQLLADLGEFLRDVKRSVPSP
jgi:hypothetical protein